MNINNDNYEEYFLLYADNELAPAQRKIVEMFVKANPHLRKEWNELLATIQSPESISLRDKSFLLKRPVDGFIDKDNYEKRFVEYHDLELREEEKSFVQHFLKEQPSLQREFDFLGKSYLSSDNSIEFPEKAALYKKSALVRYGLFIRIAAVAAVFIGFVFWLGLQLTQEHNPQRTIVHNIPSVNIPEKVFPEQKRVIKKPALAGHQSPKTIPNKSATANVIKTRNSENTERNEQKQPFNDSKAESNVLQETAEIAAMIPIANNNAAFDADSREPISTIANTINQTNTINHNDIDLTPVKELPQAYPASFRQEPVENNYVFTDIPAENFQRSKLGILIKKVKRTIDRNNPINQLFNGDED